MELKIFGICLLLLVYYDIYNEIEKDSDWSEEFSEKVYNEVNGNKIFKFIRKRDRNS